MSQTVLDVSQAPSNQPNILDNAGFEVWQRGTSFSSPANGALTADRWAMTYITPNPTFTISQESTTVDSGSFSCKINVTNANSTPFMQFLQSIENFIAYAGRTVTLSMRVWSNVAGANIELFDFAAHFGQSSNHPGDSQWHTLTCTLTCGTRAQMTGLSAAFNLPSPSVNGTHYIDSAMLTIGPAAPTFVPLHPAVDLMRCQRYFETAVSPYGDTFRSLGINNGAQYQLSSYQPFSVYKRVSPTITVTPQIAWEQGSTTNVQASYGFFAANSQNQGFELGMQKSAGGNFPTLLQAFWTASAD